MRGAGRPDHPRVQSPKHLGHPKGPRACESSLVEPPSSRPWQWLAAACRATTSPQASGARLPGRGSPAPNGPNCYQRDGNQPWRLLLA